MSTLHKSVLLKETIDLLQPEDGKVYVDLTLGGGGHSLEILKRAKDATLIALDIDKSAVENFKKEIGKSKKVHVINTNFTDLKNQLDLLKINKVNGVIADLGWSSDQLGGIQGLSYDNPFEELDMRFNNELGVRAADLLNALGKKELEKMFEMYADIYGTKNKKLVEAINKFRSKQLFEKVEDLTKVIDSSFNFAKFSRFKGNEKYQMYSKVFQALRIAVNNELNNLKEMLSVGFETLEKEGKFLVITFHSGEEKIVKGFFQSLEKEGKAEFITKKFDDYCIRPGVEELRENIRSRSAKLLGIKKVI